VGRLATYKYYNMDQIVAQALTVYAKMNSVKRKEALTLDNGHPNGKQIPATTKIIPEITIRSGGHGGEIRKTV
jgi:hypothetical protein